MKKYHSFCLKFLYQSILLVFVLMLFSRCAETPKKYVYDGLVQGSYYHIIFYANSDKGIKNGIDSIFSAIDNSVSLWNKNSLINKINDNTDYSIDSIFADIFRCSEYYYRLTDGCFDPTIGAVVKEFGFTTKTRDNVNLAIVDSLQQFIGYNNVELRNGKIVKKFPQTQLDFNAIAQGYTSDCVADYLRKNGITSFIVDIGGEVMTGDLKPDGKKWSVGIELPDFNNNTSNRKTSDIIYLANQSVVTSGNYRKFFVKDGVRYSHTIAPRTCRPVTHTLLSASVVAPDAKTADALATAFMVMGVEETKKFLSKHTEFAAYLIFENEKKELEIYKSENFNQYLRQ